jgi:hypothetical protein
MKLLIVQLSPFSFLHPFLVQIFSLEPCSQTPSVYSHEATTNTIQNAISTV